MSDQGTAQVTRQPLLNGDSCAHCGKVSLWRFGQDRPLGIHTCTPFPAQSDAMREQRQSQLAWLAAQRAQGKIR